MEQTNMAKIYKNQTYVVDILDFGSNGEGVAKIDGFTVFVPFALPDETVEILIVQLNLKYNFLSIHMIN